MFSPETIMLTLNIFIFTNIKFTLQVNINSNIGCGNNFQKWFEGINNSNGSNK